MATGDCHKSTFNKTQQVVLDTILAGHNVVVLGKAGTGKTFLLRRIIELLKPSKQIEVTSASGISTLLFESAKTLHSFANINTCREAKEDIFKRIKTSSPDIIKKWQSLEALIIDEALLIMHAVYSQHEKELTP